VNRREVLQVGCSGLLGLGLSRSLMASTSSSTPASSGGKAKKVLMVFLTGAPSHIDTFDPKPDAPEEVRGLFKPMASNVTGIQVCEHLPQIAARMDKIALVRSMTHPTPVHELGTHFLLSGIDNLPPGANHMATRHDWPNYASGLDYSRPRQDGIPNGVLLPTYLNAGYGFSGQSAGVLGAKYDPWHVKSDPNQPNFKVDDLQMGGLSVEQIHNRESLLKSVDHQQSLLERVGESRDYDQKRSRAFGLLTSGRLSSAFDLNREAPATRDRYGRHLFGQSLLLSRRLLEAGVPYVQAHMGTMNNWDTHTGNCQQLKDRLLPPFDRGFSALIDDLESRGLLEETMVVVVGEFGRTPKMGTDNGGNITGKDGRDHWAGCFFALFAGGGTRGGQVIGKSDRVGAYPALNPVKPSDLGATVYRALGLEPETEVIDRTGRPMILNRGTPIPGLLG
jgi:Protein of unknown function (DUF1501)